MLGDPTSLTFDAYRRLRVEVLSGRLPPGRKLKIQELADEMSVSPGVVREALSRLSSESLVVAIPQRGFRVAPITAEDVHDLTEARVDIETACLKRSLAAGKVAWEADIVAALHLLNRTPHNTVDLSGPWTDAHAQFHEALVSACESKWLLRVREQLFIQGERYRWINIRMSDADRGLHEEHSEMAEAAISRNIALTCELMERHLRLTEELTLRSLASELVPG
jgi:DNA-binding GntR family transcriptional regulator